MSTSTSFAATSEDTTVLSSSTVPATAETATVSEVYFEAIYDFATSDEGDLPFKAGDIIAASAQQNLEEPWLAGFLNGVGGWFPQNYTRRLDSKPSAAVSTSQPQQNLFSGQLSSTNAANGGASNASANFTSTVTTTDHNQFNHKSSSLTQFSSSTSSSAAASPQILCKVRANYPFEATAEGDLGLAAGDTVCVTSKDGDWWTGFLSTDPNSTSGIFPSNFVEVIQTFPTMAASSATGLSQAATTPQTLTLPTVSDAGAGTGKPGQELASVIAEFHGDSPEQLNLSVGDVIIVKKKLDSGWWEGQIQGEKKKGWFPGDYVRLISSGLTPIASANSSPERKAPGTAERVRAQFAFTAERDDELTFNVGDVINILCKDDNDWWTGELRGKSGLFPSNFVSPL